MWKLNCAQVASFDEAVVAKDAEIEQLKLKISGLEACSGGGAPAALTVPVTRPPISVSQPSLTRFAASGSVATESVPIPLGAPTSACKGKAPPVNEFSGEDLECPLDDWLPSLERASAWNDWSEEERMMQLAGHLKGRTLQEWNLLQPEERASFARVTEALHLRLDSGSKAVAAQDFRHTTHRDSEPAADFIRRLERTFRIAYGRDQMSSETRDTLLYGQMQEGLRIELMRGPAVSGARGYQELCIAAKNEEKRLADL